MRLPFIGNTSLHLEKELKSFFRRQLSVKLSLNVVHDYYKISNMFKHQKLLPKLYRHRVLYKVTCTCGTVYNCTLICDQTQRNITVDMNFDWGGGKRGQTSKASKFFERGTFVRQRYRRMEDWFGT